MSESAKPKPMTDEEVADLKDSLSKGFQIPTVDGPRLLATVDELNAELDECIESVEQRESAILVASARANAAEARVERLEGLLREADAYTNEWSDEFRNRIDSALAEGRKL